MKRILKSKRILALILVLVAIAGIATAFAASTPDEALGDIRVYQVGDSFYYLAYAGTPQKCDYFVYTGTSILGESTEYPAYCVQPTLAGPNTAGPYSCDASTYVTNPQIYGIVSNGYPYKTLGELGVNTIQQAFYATKLALWTYLRGWDVNSWTATDPEQECTLAALKQIYNAGMAVTSIPTPMLTATPDNPTVQLDTIDPNYASQTYTVTANMDIRSYTVALEGTTPDGTKITDVNNNPQTTFNAGDKFKVLVPADKISGITGSFNLVIKGQLRTNAVIYAISYDSSLQSFAATKDPFDFENATATVNYSSQNTFIDIIKLSAGTNTPLAGATFKVTGPDGVIGTFSTDASGHILVPLTKSGDYQVDEIAAPSG